MSLDCEIVAETKGGFFGLLGYYTDALNFLCVRARYYRPQLTRWQTVDPLWPEQEPYSYAQLNPTFKTDKSGLGYRPCTPSEYADAEDYCYDNFGEGVLSCGYITGSFCGLDWGIGVRACGGSPKSGDCTPAQKRVLQATVKLACGVPHGCTPEDSCETLGKKVLAGIACLTAREAINNICYGGGDPAHTGHVAQTKRAVDNCEHIFHSKHCRWIYG